MTDEVIMRQVILMERSISVNRWQDDANVYINKVLCCISQFLPYSITTASWYDSSIETDFLHIL